MCDCLIWHPVWRAAARRARVRPALVLAIRAALIEDPQSAHPAVLAEGLAVQESAVARVLEAFKGLGVTIDGHALASQLPAIESRELADAMVKPATLRKRRQRERERAAKLSTDAGVRDVSRVGRDQGVTAVPPVTAQQRIFEEIRQELGIGASRQGVTSRDVVTPPRIRNQNIRDKNARRGELGVAVSAKPAPAEPSEAPYLDNKAITRLRWVKGCLEQAEKEVRLGLLKRETLDWLLHTLPDRLVEQYALRQCNLPTEAYRQLNELDSRRRQKSMLLPVNGKKETAETEPQIKAGPGAPGSGTLAPVDGELPTMLSA